MPTNEQTKGRRPEIVKDDIQTVKNRLETKVGMASIHVEAASSVQKSKVWGHAKGNQHLDFMAFVHSCAVHSEVKSFLPETERNNSTLVYEPCKPYGGPDGNGFQPVRGTSIQNRPNAP